MQPGESGGGGASRPTSGPWAKGTSRLGVIYMCAGIFCMSVTDVLAKWLGESYPVGQIVFFRMLWGLPLIVALAWASEGRRMLATTRLLLHVLRGVLAASASFFFFFALTRLPLAEASAIVFTAPLFIALLAVLVLKERANAGRWMATLGGFGGALLIVRPGSETFTSAALLPLGAAVSYALFMLSARRLPKDESIWTAMFFANAVPLAISSFFVPTFGGWPSWADMPPFIALGLFGAAAITLITQAFRVAAATIVAPFDYTGIVWATVFGLLLWGEKPALPSVVGMAVIIASGVYLASRPDSLESG